MFTLVHKKKGPEDKGDENFDCSVNKHVRVVLGSFSLPQEVFCIEDIFL